MVVKMYGVQLTYPDGRTDYIRGGQNEILYSPDQILMVGYFNEVLPAKGVESQRVVSLKEQKDITPAELKSARDVSKSLESRAS